jgi:soluble lytic murein transglycosylase
LRRQHPRRRLTLALVSALVSSCAALLPLTSASCSSAQPRPSPPQVAERLRALAHAERDRLPAEASVAAVENENPGTTAAALARLLRARIKLAANDFNGAAALLDSKVFRQLTSIADYALLLRADALAKLNRRPEARAAYEQLARDFPASQRARDAVLRDAEIALANNEAAAVPALVKKLADADDPEALLLAARSYDAQGKQDLAQYTYRRIYFYAPTSQATDSIRTAASGFQPASAEEASARANKLYEAKRYSDAADAYAVAFARFPATADSQARLRHGVAAFNAKRYADAVSSLNSVPTGAGDVRAEALLYAAQSQARLRQWDAARATLGEMRRAFPDDARTRRALTAAGLVAKELSDSAQAQNFFRAAVTAYPGAAEVAQAQFELAWAAHESKNFSESSRLLLEHLALYADRNTDNRGRAGYWAARDAERAGRLIDARVLYQAMLQRYDANWYGYLAGQRLDAMKRANSPAGATRDANTNDAATADGSQLARAVQNLSTVTVAEETAGAEANEALRRADELNVVGLDDWAVDEVDRVLQSAPASPRLTLAKARVLRSRGQNLLALVTMQKPYPDYAQMKPEELSREEWDAFYPLSYWDTISQEARARGLDPYRVAAFIRQETVFEPRAASHANAYGLMQLIMDTAQRTARRIGVDPPTSIEELYNPQLNIKLGTAYLRSQLDAYGRVEYAAAAYNAGPGRATRWKAELPAEIDEWAEAVPFKETRQYIQGIIRNTLQYRRLYDEQGRFRPEVGARPVRPALTNANAQPANDNTVRPRRIKPGEDEHTEN